MKRLFLRGSLFLIPAICAIAVSVLASGSTPDSKAFRVTTSPRYDRNPSFFKADDGTYWLFFARGRNSIGIRGMNGYDPDYDSYDIYYKTARNIQALQRATEKLLPGSDQVTFNTQRDVAALQASDGRIWVFTSSGYAPSSDPRVFYYTYEGSAWSGPTSIENTAYAGHIHALENNGQIYVFFDAWDYQLKVTRWNGVNWSSPAMISAKATLAKATVEGGMFYAVWSYVDMNANEYGKYIGLSTSADGMTWTNHGEIASWPGATNWDPVLAKDGRIFRLFWAPDAGVEGQFIAMSTSENPTSPASWSTPVKVTTASYGAITWWDFWPQVYSDGLSYLAYTSERNDAGTNMGDANIWMMHIKNNL